MNDIAEKIPAETKATGESAGMLTVIERAAGDPNVDVEKMERLYAMYNDMQERKAKQEYNAAMAAAQAEMKSVSADATNPQTRSRYASYHALDHALRPIYSRHGFAVSYDTDESPKENHIRIIALVSHAAGHTERFKRDMPITTTGIKGQAMMTATHATASAESYGMRYLLKGIFNVAIGAEDDDGNRAGKTVELITEEQAADIQALIDEVGEAGKQALFSWLKIDSIDQIPAKHYKKSVAGLEKRRKA